MKLKTLIVAIVVLAVLSAVVFVAKRPGPPPSKDPRVGQPVADRAAVEKAAKLRISDQGKTVLLTRDADGNWRDTSYYDMPADFTKLSGLVGNLTDGKIERLATSNPDRIARLEFKDTKIDLLDAADKVLWTVTLGKNADVGGGRFVRFGDENKAYLASLNAWLDTEAKNWAKAELLTVKPEDIAKVEIEFPAVAASTTEPKTEATPAGAVTLSRAKKEDAWTADKTPAGQRVKTDKVSTTLSTVTSLRFTETSDPTDANVAAAKAHQRTLKLTTFDGKTYTVALGRKPEEKKLKPPAPSADGKTGPASLGSVTDLAKKDDKTGEKKSDDKPAAPEFETIPAGPVYAWVTSSDPKAEINALMQKRAFQISEYTFTSLPQKVDELFEAAPPPPAPADDKKAEPGKPEPKK